MGPGAKAQESVEDTWRVGGQPSDTLTEYLLYRRHLFAYEEARKRCPAAEIVVDVACGLGEGLDACSRDASMVVAVDLAMRPLAQLKNSRLMPVQAAASQLPLRSGCADLVMGFQLIEHVSTDLALKIIAEVRRILRPGGHAFLTTPNARWRLRPGQRPWNPFHVVEYRAEELVRTCRLAGIGPGSIAGVVGRGGAQDVELERVRHAPPWERRLPRRLCDAVAAFRRLNRHALVRSSRAKVTASHEAKSWFELSTDFDEGLDFWIEVESA